MVSFFKPRLSVPAGLALISGSRHAATWGSIARSMHHRFASVE